MISRTSIEKHPPTEPVGAVDGLATDPQPSGIRRLAPSDGLFLRAEYLEEMQEHGRELARLGTLAGGSGVVYGFALTVAHGLLACSPGLAVDPSGVALRCPDDLHLDLRDLDHTPGRVWVVEVLAGPEVPSGPAEPLYSAVCSSPCDPGTTLRPYAESTVRLRVRAETLATRPTDDERRVSEVVSAWFERERSAGDPWLTPRSAGAKVLDPTTQPWSSVLPGAGPGPAPVPLGLLVRVGSEWYLDVWSARRDRIHPPADLGWHGRLATRPLGVFRAQLLQFQDHLSRVGASAANPLTGHFVELPPAGYLPRPPTFPDQYDLRSWYSAVFGGAARVEVTRCAADVAVSAVGLAQHLDRIPLSDANVPRDDADGLADTRPVVQVLVPDLPTDLPATSTQDRPWVAFVRSPETRRADETPPHDTGTPPVLSRPREPVESFVVLAAATTATRDRYDAEVERALSGGDRVEVGGTPTTEQLERILGRVEAETGDRAVSSVDLAVTSGDPARRAALLDRALALRDHLGIEPTGGVYVVPGPDQVAEDAVVLLVRTRGAR